MRKIDLSDLICIFAAGVLLLMTVLSAVGTDRTPYKLWTGILCALFCLLPMLFHHARVMRLPLALVLMIEVSIFIHAYGVLLMSYDDIFWYDTVTHLAASITVGLLVFYSLVAVELIDHKAHFGPKWIPLFIFLIMSTFSVYWEVLELVVDTASGINMQYSPWDTIRDMVCNEIGTIMVTVGVRFYLKSHSCEDFIESLELHPSLKRVASSQSHRAERPANDNVPAIPASVDVPASEGISGSMPPQQE